MEGHYRGQHRRDCIVDRAHRIRGGFDGGHGSSSTPRGVYSAWVRRRRRDLSACLTAIPLVVMPFLDWAKLRTARAHRLLLVFADHVAPPRSQCRLRLVVGRSSRGARHCSLGHAGRARWLARRRFKLTLPSPSKAPPAAPQRVGDHRHRIQAHRRARDDGGLSRWSKRGQSTPAATRASIGFGLQTSEKHLDLFLRLEIAGARRHLEALPVRGPGLLQSSRSL